MNKIGRALLLLTIVAATALAGLLSSEPATYARETARPAAALTAVGPTVPVPGTTPATQFPAWYKDANGVALALCVDGTANCLATTADLDPSNPAAAGEAFWWDAEVIGLPVGSGSVLLVLAMEAAFATGNPVAGQEISFGRVRIRGSGLTAGGTYVVTHPYGTQTFANVPAGPGLNINFSDDVGVAAGVFTGALGSGIGPFLTAVSPAPPAGYVGNPGINQTVTGSPTGNNFFRVVGPEGTFETNLFSVQGKLAVSSANDTARVPAGSGPVPIDVLGNDGPGLTVSAVTAPANGVSAIAGGGAWVTYDTNLAVTGTDVFTYTATATGGITGTAKVDVAVHAGNVAPVAVNDAFTVTINSTGNVLSVLANDVDDDLDLKFVSDVAQPTAGGVVAVGVAGTNVVFTPTAAFSGTTSFGYTVSDGLATDVGTATVTVNTPPVAVTDVATVTANTTNNVISVLANDSDVNGNALSVSAVTTPSSGTAAIGLAGANVLYTPLGNFGGTAVFTYTVTDGAATASAGVTVTVNRFPVAASDAITVGINTISNTLNVLANDSDPDGNTITITAVSQPARGTASIGTGNILYTPNAGIFGTDPFTYTISDGVAGGVLTATATVTPTVNRPPVAGGDAVRIPFGSISNTITVRANDTDPDGNPITVTDVSQPTHGETAVGTGGANVVYTPHTTFAGEGTFTYTISDGHLTAPGTVTVTVHRGPAAGSDNFRIAQNSLNNVLNVLVNDSDPEGDAIAIPSVPQPANGVVSIGSGGVNVIYTPDAGFFGGDSFTYTVSDGQISATANVTILVNRAPLAFGDVVTLQRNTTSNPVNVLGNDRDPDGDTLVITAVSQPASGVVSIGPGGLVLLYTANAGFTGTDSFSYSISDGQLTASATAAVNVPDQRTTNTAPLAVNDSVTVPRNSTSNAINALANDADQDGDSLRVIAVGTPISGTASIATGGSVVLYTPNRAFSGSDSFTYTVTDGLLSSTATVNVSVPANIAPAAVNDTLTVARNSINNPLPVLGNDADPDNDLLTVTVVGSAANGTAAVGPGGTAVIYTPRLGFDGTDSFTYFISDGSLGANATVTVTVHSLNHGPLALNDTATVGVSSSANRIEVLSNDSDSDGDPVSVSPVISQPANGTATVGPGRGSILYTPVQGFAGTDTFTYTVTDGDLSSPAATVTVSVRGAKLFMPVITQNIIPAW